MGIMGTTQDINRKYYMSQIIRYFSTSNDKAGTATTLMLMEAF